MYCSISIWILYPLLFEQHLCFLSFPIVRILGFLPKTKKLQHQTRGQCCSVPNFFMQPLIDSLLTIPLPICCLPFLTSFTNLLKVFYFGLTFAVVAPVSFWRFFATHQFLGDLLLLQVMMMRTPLYPSLPYISLTYNCTFFIYLPPDCLGLFVPLPFSYTWLAFSALFFLAQFAPCISTTSTICFIFLCAGPSLSWLGKESQQNRQIV